MSSYDVLLPNNGLLRPRCIAPTADFAVLLLAPGLQVQQFLLGSLGADHESAFKKWLVNGDVE